MSVEVPRNALAISETLDHYGKLGLEDPILCGGSALYWQLAVATGPKVESLPVGLSDVDALASYTNIRALHDAIEAGAGYIINEWREESTQRKDASSRATLRVELSDSQEGIIPLETFTGVETDRISVTHDVVSRRHEAIDAEGIACLPIARILAWKIIADRPKDRAQVAAYISFIKENRAVSYDEWDAIRTTTQEAKDKLWSIKHAEQIVWSGSG
jgi:hypothetical protein